ncbi:MAG: intradiol ring-cleavage dioxygenase [Betaproteobacteria bacterium]|nr:MAG: intradiol ring-cleavage dioxygenase [Betaproteobacteria bacterium]
MPDRTEANLTDAVVKRIEGASDARFRQVMTSLVRHLHAFVRETQLTEDEWRAGIEFLTATGHKCDDKRQEFILLSDTLGVSMLVDAINHQKPEGATESTVLGPFYVRGAPDMPLGANIAEGVEGEPVYFSGKVVSSDGTPIGGATLDIWSTDGAGQYDVQRPDGVLRARGRITTDAQGHYAFWTVKPVSYPIPVDGPVGKMMLGLGRHPYRPAHTHMIVAAPGHETVTTHLFVKGDPYLESDAVFAVKDSLVVDFVAHEAGVAPDGKKVDEAWWSVDYDFGLVTQTQSAAA